MTDTDQESRHDHAGHAHAHDDGGPAAPIADPAQQSLADALRVSFRILTLIMIGVIGVYVFTGVKFVRPQQVGILKIFGREVGTAGEGLTYNWPFPIGEIELVSTNEQELTIDDFWMHETAEDKTRKSLLARTARYQGLRPGWDGALLTGDRNLLHVRLSCTYSIRRPVDYRRQVRDTDLDKMDHLQAVIRSVVCQAAIRAAARRTADGIQRTEQHAFKADILDLAQKQLDTLLASPQDKEAVRINQVLLRDTSWPLRALSAYNQAQQASNEKEKRISAAKAEASEILNSACGPRNVGKLVGDVLGARGRGQPASRPGTEEPKGPQGVDLIEQYTQVLRLKGQEKQAQELLRTIDEVLLSPGTAGDASRILQEARGERTTIIQDAERRATRFRELVEEYRLAPQLMLERHWAEVLDEILNTPTAEKYYLIFRNGKTVVKINRDPQIAKEIERELLKKAKDKKPSTK